jgi:hypothetical protein
VAGAWTFPPLEVPYFDPFEKRYGVARSEAASLAAEAPVEAAALTPEAAPPTGAGTLHPRPANAARWKTWLPWSLAVVFASAFAVAVSVRRPKVAAGQSSGLASGLAQSTAPPSAALASALERPGRPLAAARRDALHQRIAAAGREEHARQTAAAAEEAVREGLEASWDLPLSTPISQWRLRLAERGAPDDLLQEIDPLGGPAVPSFRSPAVLARTHKDRAMRSRRPPD